MLSGKFSFTDTFKKVQNLRNIYLRNETEVKFVVWFEVKSVLVNDPEILINLKMYVLSINVFIRIFFKLSVSKTSKQTDFF